MLKLLGLGCCLGEIWQEDIAEAGQCLRAAWRQTNPSSLDSDLSEESLVHPVLMEVKPDGTKEPRQANTGQVGR